MLTLQYVCQDVALVKSTMGHGIFHVDVVKLTMLLPGYHSHQRLVNPRTLYTYLLLTKRPMADL